MKSLLPLAIAALLIGTSCSKKDGSADSVLAPLSASFSLASQTAPKEGTAIQFTNTSTGGAAYAWDFGNGRTSADKAPAFTYPACGNYTIRLTVTNENGEQKSFSQQVTVDCIFRAPTDPPVTHAPLF